MVVLTVQRWYFFNNQLNKVVISYETMSLNYKPSYYRLKILH